MSVNMQTLFAFNRPLPPPFDTLKSKKVKVSSMYGDGTEATLSLSMIKAVNAYCRCRDGSGQGALGLSDGRNVAEYKSSISPDAYNLVVYDPAAGNMMAIEYDKNTEVSQIYHLTASGRDGSALLFSLMPTLMEDEEFAENIEAYRAELSLGVPDAGKAGNIMAILCDNAYRRIKDDTCPAHIKLNIDKTGNLTRIPKVQLEAGKYIPQTVVCGEFSIIAQTGPAPVYKPTVLIEHCDFVGKYPINPSRCLNVREKLLVPKLPAWYVIPKEVVSICQHAVKTKKPCPCAISFCAVRLEPARPWALKPSPPGLACRMLSIPARPIPRYSISSGRCFPTPRERQPVTHSWTRNVSSSCAWAVSRMRT